MIIILIFLCFILLLNMLNNLEVQICIGKSYEYFQLINFDEVLCSMIIYSLILYVLIVIGSHGPLLIIYFMLRVYDVVTNYIRKTKRNFYKILQEFLNRGLHRGCVIVLGQNN